MIFTFFVLSFYKDIQKKYIIFDIIGEKSMLNFVLCDDNLNILSKLKEMFEILFFKNDIDAQVSFTSDKADEIYNYVTSNHVDVLVLDINLKSNVSGIELAKQIRKDNKDIYIIFSTGHLEYSLIAYSVKTFDYLPKPLTMERLEITLNRLLDDINSNKNKKFIKINNGTIVKEKEINFVKRNGMKVVFCTDSKEYETYSSFNKIESILSGNFVRCHKSFIVNTSNIYNIDKNTIIFKNNSTCGIGPKYKDTLMEVFKNGNF